MTTKTETRATKQLLVTEVIEAYPAMLKALRAIAEMKITPETNHEELSALMIAIAQVTLYHAVKK